MRKFLCWIGWHSWIWTDMEGEAVYLKGPPPFRATCIDCGVPYVDHKP